MADLALCGCGDCAKFDYSQPAGRGFWERPADVIEALDLRAGQTVADIGTGDGYFVPWLSEEVGPQATLSRVFDTCNPRGSEILRASEVCMLGPEDLVLCSGTLLKGSIQEMVEAAVAGGYKALTLWPQDVDRAHAEGHSDADLRRLLADNGLVVADLDPLLDWTPQATPKEGEALFGVPGEDEFYAIAESLGATSLNAVQGFGAELDLDRASEDLAGVCGRAKEHGLIVTIEFLPWSGIPDVATAHDLVQRSGCDNATILVDTWHFFRGSSTLDQLRAVPGEKVGSTQFNDAPAQRPDDLMTETIEARLLPGEGDIPIVDIIRVLDEIGSRAPIGVEVFNSRHDAMAPADVGRQTAEATRRLLAQARRTRGL